LKTRYGFTLAASYELLALDLEALKNGLITETNVPTLERIAYLEAYRKNKPFLLEGELFHAGSSVCFGDFSQTRSRICVGEINTPLEKEVFCQGGYSPPCTLAYQLNNSFYPLLVLQVHFLFRKEPFSVFLKADEITFDEFKRSSFVFAIYSRQADEWAFRRIDLSILPEQYWDESKKWSQRETKCSDINQKINEEKHSLGFWHEAKLYAESYLIPNIGAKTAFYFTRIEEEFWHLLRIWHKMGSTGLGEIIELEVAKFPRSETQWDLSSPAALYLQAVERISKDANSFLADFIALSKRINELGLNSLAGWVNAFLRLCIWSPSITSYGKKIPTITLANPFVLEYIDLSTDFSNENLEEYFATMSFEMPWYFKETIGAGNIQVSKDVFKANFPLFLDNLDDAKNLIKDQLEEAVALKQSVIPFGGFFLLQGAVSGLKLFEINQDVFCVFAFNNGRYIRFIINPYDKTLTCPPDPGSIAFSAGENLYQTVRVDELQCPQLLCLFVLISAIIRDSWVVEVREAVFGAGVFKRKASPLLGDRREPLVVYLPRIRYARRSEEVNQVRQELNYAVRSQHWVRGHLRKAVKASPAQILLAQKVGVYIPEGKTWVKEHRRGDQAAERIYRSRSALRLLGAITADTAGADSWFGFERNVKRWLESFGYETEHKAASRNGDGGIDIQASKGSEHLYVQCKYWKDPVGINVVREMIGTLITYPENSRGVIVTSSELTIPARELALQHRIQFVENVSFERPIDKGLKKRP